MLLLDQAKAERPAAAPSSSVFLGTGTWTPLEVSGGALTHNEPDRKRSRFVGEVHNVEGAYWAHRAVLEFAKALWGSSLTEEIRNDVDGGAG